MVNVGGKGSGRKAKPVEQHIRLGNPSKKKLPNKEQLSQVVGLPITHVPDPHRPLGQTGRELWDRIWTSGAGWLSRGMDAEIVLLVCEATDERTRLRVKLQQQPDAWRDRRALRELDRQIISLLAQIGFSPADRGTLMAGQPQQHTLADLHKRIAAKRAAR